MMKPGLIIIFCSFVIEVTSRSVPTISNGLSEQEVSEYTSRDNFGLEGEVYIKTRKKAKQYRILYARIHNNSLPDEPYLSSVLFGDILYTEAQLTWLMTQLRESHKSRQKRKAINYDTYPYKKWKDKIPYTFSNIYAHSESEKEYIRRCFEMWQNETCVRFVEIDLNSTKYKDFVYIERKIGCYSHYGRVGGRQLLGLGQTCFMPNGYGYVVHEIGHVIGLFHEHSRYDRDDHVTIYENNIRPGEGHNFVKFDERELETYNLPYDYTSVMHYGSRSFSVDGNNKDTIRTLDPLYQLTIGQRYKQSFLDVKAVNMAYCQDTCSRSSLSCQRGGYLDPNNCQRCKCPDGYHGQLCQYVMASSKDVCPYAGQVPVASQPSCIRVGPYNDNTECTWLLKAPKDCQIEFWFEGEFHVLQGVTSGPTCLHYVEVQYKGTDTNPGPRFCGKRLPNFDKVTSENDEILVNFRTPQTISEKTLAGFTMCYKTTDTCTADDVNNMTPYLWGKYQTSTKRPYTKPTLYQTTSHQTTSYQTTSYQTTSYRRHTTSRPIHAMTSSPPSIFTTTRAPPRDTSAGFDRVRMVARMTSPKPIPISTSGARSGYTLDKDTLKFGLSPTAPSARSEQAVRRPGLQTTSSVDDNRRTTRSTRRTTVARLQPRTGAVRNYWWYPAAPRS